MKARTKSLVVSGTDEIRLPGWLFGCLARSLVKLTRHVEMRVTGYLYFHAAPSPLDFHQECIKRVKNLHTADCLRANKSTMAWGLEARVPFLDKEFLDVSLSIRPEDKVFDKGTMQQKDKDGKPIMEKYILRKAFDCEPEGRVSDCALQSPGGGCANESGALSLSLSRHSHISPSRFCGVRRNNSQMVSATPGSTVSKPTPKRPSQTLNCHPRKSAIPSTHPRRKRRTIFVRRSRVTSPPMRRLARLSGGFRVLIGVAQVTRVAGPSRFTRVLIEKEWGTVTGAGGKDRAPRRARCHRLFEK